jgi:hypothetical protein
VNTELEYIPITNGKSKNRFCLNQSECIAYLEVHRPSTLDGQRDTFKNGKKIYADGLKSDLVTIDLEDLDRVSEFRWTAHLDGYLSYKPHVEKFRYMTEITTGDSVKRFYLDRLIMNPKDYEQVIRPNHLDLRKSQLSIQFHRSGTRQRKATAIPKTVMKDRKSTAPCVPRLMGGSNAQPCMDAE